MHDFQPVAPAVHLADERKKRGDPLPLQVRDYGLFVLGAGVDGIPLRPRPTKGAVRIYNNWFTQSALYSHTHIL
jgi:hypothetical protein